jgi:hypothetical protein
MVNAERAKTFCRKNRGLRYRYEKYNCAAYSINGDRLRIAIEYPGIVRFCPAYRILVKGDGPAKSVLFALEGR